MIRVILFLLLSVFVFTGKASAAPFRFESIGSLDEMSNFIKENFSLQSKREDFRRVFVDEGRATLKIHSIDQNTEKYIYDINLCDYYIWRWNISADYDGNGILQQAYLNGNIVFPEGTPLKQVSKKAEEGRKASIYKAQRPRPEASKGEKSLGFILFDRDSDSKTTTDQVLIGAGPSKLNPADMGTMVVYTDIDPWRSIFDFDEADRIHLYGGDCAAADRAMEAAKSDGKK